MPNGQTARGFTTVPTEEAIRREFELISPTQDPAFQELLQSILGQVPEVREPPELLGAEQLIPQTLQVLSPILQGLLQELGPQEQRARQELTGAFRAAGGGAGPTRGTPFAQATAQLEEGFQRARGGLLARVLGQVSPLLASLLQEQQQRLSAFQEFERARFRPGQQLLQALRLIAPQPVETGRVTTGQEFLPQETLFLPPREPIRPTGGARRRARSPLEGLLKDLVRDRERPTGGRPPRQEPEPDIGVEAIPLLPSPGGEGAIRLNPETGFFESVPGPQAPGPIVPPEFGLGTVEDPFEFMF